MSTGKVARMLRWVLAWRGYVLRVSVEVEARHEDKGAHCRLIRGRWPAR